MTRPAGQQDDKAAAGWFAAIMTLALGGAGLIIAALAVGAEQAWNGGANEGRRQRERGMGWLDTQRAWLEQDHKARTDRARTYREWMSGGSNPDTAPPARSWWRKLRDVARRQTAHVALAGQDFTRGARDGWRAANQTRRDGGGFRDIIHARPVPAAPAAAAVDTPGQIDTDVCRSCRRPGVPVAYNGSCTDCNQPTRSNGSRADVTPDSTDESATDDAEKPAAEAEIFGAAGMTSSWACRRCRATGSGFPTQETARDDAVRHQQSAHQDHIDDTVSTEGEPMAQPTTAASSPATPAQTATESNATVLRAKLQNTKTTLHQIADLTDQLAAERDRLEQQVRDADEFARVTGQSNQARTALDESNAIAAAMGAKLGEFSQGAVSAEESMGQASDGLRIAENAEDELRSAGADGRAVAPAGANA